MCPVLRDINALLGCYSPCRLHTVVTDSNRNTWNRRYLCSFGSYSVFGMNGISVHAAPYNRMNRMKGMRFTRNRQNTRSFGKFLAEILRGRPRRSRLAMFDDTQVAYADIVVLRSPPIPFTDLKHVGAFFSKLNKNSQNSPERMHPK